MDLDDNFKINLFEVRKVVNGFGLGGNFRRVR